jgi:hypothetical protein
VRHKLITYSLNPGNEVGGDKARGFATILGIECDNIEYLEGAIQTGIMVTAIDTVRDNFPYGINCMIALPIRGLGKKNGRIIDARTVWEIPRRGVPPRLVSAYLRP